MVRIDMKRTQSFETAKGSFTLRAAPYRELAGRHPTQNRPKASNIAALWHGDFGARH